jgi:hypothetical protein
LLHEHTTSSVTHAASRTWDLIILEYWVSSFHIPGLQKDSGVMSPIRM